MRIILKISNNILADPVEAIEDIWFVSDRFLVTKIPALQTMRSANRIERKNEPYIYKQFNVRFCYTNLANTDTITKSRISNALIDQLNRKKKLPTYLVFMPDYDILKNIENIQEINAAPVIDEQINWLMKHVKRSIDIRIEQLVKKCPGAVRINPTFIWLQMIDRPITYQNKDVMEWRRRFNRILLDTMDKYRDQKDMKVTSLLTRQHFHSNGILSVEGCEQMWLEIDDKIRKLDIGEDTE